MRLDSYSEVIEQCIIAGHPAIYIDTESVFSDLQYKIILENQIQGLVECRKLKINEKYYLLFVLRGKSCLKEIGSSLSMEEITSVLCSIVKCITDVYENGYLKISNFIFNSSDIYINRNSTQAYMCYMPVDISEQTEEETLNQMRNFFVKIMQNSVLCNTFEGQVCINYLKGKKLDFYEIMHFVKDVISHKQCTNLSNNEIKLESLSSLHDIKFSILENRFIIGKYFLLSNGKVIKENTVSREHCEIIRENEKIYVRDLNSKNGTFLKMERLIPGKKYKLSNGDVLVIANIPFKVSIKEE